MDDVGVVLLGGTEAVEEYQGFAGAVAAQSGDVDARPTDSEGQGRRAAVSGVVSSSESLSGQGRHQAVCGFVEAVGAQREVEAQVVL